MKHLLHTCCGPCLLYPFKVLRNKGFDITCFFYNPNIHPFTEYKKRKTSLAQFSATENIPLVIQGEYGFDEFIRAVVFKEKKRCSLCYDIRIEETVRYAVENNFSSFSTTLLYSKYQNHDLIKQKCLDLSERFNIQFVYEDFRSGWQEGIDYSLKKNLYRQPYCGCIYSERERYDNRYKKRIRQQQHNKRDHDG